MNFHFTPDSGRGTLCSVVSPGPDSAAECVFHPYDERNARPRATFGDADERRMLDTGELREGPYAVTCRLLANDESYAAGDLGDYVVRLGIRPAGSELRRALPGCTDHASQRTCGGDNG